VWLFRSVVSKNAYLLYSLRILFKGVYNACTTFISVLWLCCTTGSWANICDSIRRRYYSVSVFSNGACHNVFRTCCHFGCSRGTLTLVAVQIYDGKSYFATYPYNNANTHTHTHTHTHKDSITRSSPCHVTELSRSTFLACSYVDLIVKFLCNLK
jgi:hypothetical protein